MPFEIVKATSADAEALTPIGAAAFLTDGLNLRIGDPRTFTPEQTRESEAWRQTRFKARADGPGKFWFKAIDSETGRIAGYSGIFTPESVKAGAASLNAGDGDIEIPSFLDRAFMDVMEERMKGFKGSVLGERKEQVWYVPSMAVHPDFQGKGVAGKLLAAEFELADEDGQDVYLESTPVARQMYQRAGFEAIGTLDLSDLTADEYFLTAMLRKAKLKSSGAAA
ncbi:hypothetical protein B0A48_12904 [Cryoendolithus antarcticus]|uniref:N-acetyltransferase domain-containing protein n=1 Tax=Cryoendolithus antarcticus TaxID=1507870 RepID=A0A1V8SQI2_9PEZI|nr:hypothetical protein B0A48_12904 [Cryoendolithus antarcticus]